LSKISAFIVAGLLFAFVPSEASAWYCRAVSPSGAWGWGRSGSLERARQIAFSNCAARRRGYACRIRSCVP
jgi:hypothetical protein